MNSLVISRREGILIASSPSPFFQTEPAGLSMTKEVIMSIFSVWRPKRELSETLPGINDRMERGNVSSGSQPTDPPVWVKTRVLSPNSRAWMMGSSLTSMPASVSSCAKWG